MSASPNIRAPGRRIRRDRIRRVTGGRTIRSLTFFVPLRCRSPPMMHRTTRARPEPDGPRYPHHRNRIETIIAISEVSALAGQQRPLGVTERSQGEFSGEREGQHFPTHLHPFDCHCAVGFRLSGSHGDKLPVPHHPHRPQNPILGTNTSRSLRFHQMNQPARLSGLNRSGESGDFLIRDLSRRLVSGVERNRLPPDRRVGCRRSIRRGGGGCTYAGDPVKGAGQDASVSSRSRMPSKTF